MKRKLFSNTAKAIAIGLAVAMGAGTAISGVTGNVEVVKANQIKNVTGTYTKMTGKVEVTLKLPSYATIKGFDNKKILDLYEGDVQIMELWQKFKITTDTGTADNPQVLRVDATKFETSKEIKILFEYTGPNYKTINVQYKYNKNDAIAISNTDFISNDLIKVKVLADSPLADSYINLNYLPNENKIKLIFPSSLRLGDNIEKKEQKILDSGFRLKDKDGNDSTELIDKYKYTDNTGALEFYLKENEIINGKVDGIYTLDFNNNIVNSPFLVTTGNLQNKPSGTTREFKIDETAPTIKSAKVIKDDNGKNKKIEVNFGENLDTTNLDVTKLKDDFTVTESTNNTSSTVVIDSAKIDGQKVILTLQNELKDSTKYTVKYTGTNKSVKDKLGNEATTGTAEVTTNFNNLVQATLKDRQLTLETSDSTTLKSNVNEVTFSVKINDTVKKDIKSTKKLNSTDNKLVYEIETKDLALTEDSEIILSYAGTDIKIVPSNNSETDLVLDDIYTVNGLDVKGPEIDSTPETPILKTVDGDEYNSFDIDFEEKLYSNGKEVTGDVKDYFELTGGNKVSIKSAMYDNGKVTFTLNKSAGVTSATYTLKGKTTLTDKNKNKIEGAKSIHIDAEVSKPTITYVKEGTDTKKGEIVLAYPETLYQNAGGEQLTNDHVRNMFEVVKDTSKGYAKITDKAEYVASTTTGGNTVIKIPVTEVKTGEITLKFKKGTKPSQGTQDAQKEGKPLYDRVGNKTDVDSLTYTVRLESDGTAPTIKMDTSKKTFIYKYKFDNINADELNLPIVASEPIKVSNTENSKNIFEVFDGNNKINDAIKNVTTEANRVNIDFNMDLLKDNVQYTVKYKNGITDLSGNEVSTKDFNTSFKLNRTGVVVNNIGRVFEVLNNKNIIAVNDIDTTVAYRDYAKFETTVDTLGNGEGKIEGIKNKDIEYLNKTKNNTNKVVSLGSTRAMVVALANTKSREVVSPAIKKINDNAFNGNTDITEVNLPTVKEVGRNAFANTENLTEVSLPKATVVKENAFKDASSLETVAIGTKADTKVEFAESIFSGAGSKTNKVITVSTNKDSATNLKDAIGENKKITGTTLNTDGTTDKTVTEGNKDWKPSINSSGGTNGGGYSDNYYKAPKNENTNTEENKETKEDGNTKESTKTLSIDTITLPTILGASKVFSDVSPTHWASAYIDKLSKAGIINGMKDGSFNPRSNTKRADVTIMISKLLGIKASNTDNFNDVNPNAYYAPYVAAIKEYGIINGFNGNFNPDGYITRQDTMVIIGQMLKELGINIDTDTSVLDKFSDKKGISGYANEYVAILVNSGIIVGDNGKINPEANITRAEISTIISKVYDLIETEIANQSEQEIATDKEIVSIEKTTEETTATETTEAK